MRGQAVLLRHFVPRGNEPRLLPNTLYAVRSVARAVFGFLYKKYTSIFLIYFFGSPHNEESGCARRVDCIGLLEATSFCLLGHERSKHRAAPLLARAARGTVWLLQKELCRLYLPQVFMEVLLFGLLQE